MLPALHWHLLTPFTTHPPPALQLLDKANEASDRKLARHLISLYGNGVGRLGNEVRWPAVGLPA